MSRQHHNIAHAEKRALQLSLFGTLIASGSGLLAGFLFNSQAILLDGVFSLLSMGMTGLALYTTQLIHRPEDDTFQFGYSHLEPLASVLQGLVILAICIVAFFTGIETLLSGGSEVKLSFASVYTVLLTALCFGIYYFERRIVGVSRSELIRVDAQEWLIDGILSSTLLVGFVAAIIIKQSNHPDWSKFIPMIDPILTILLALFASILPIRVMSKNFREVLLVSPAHVNEQVQARLESIIAAYGFSDYSCHLAKTGRKYDLEINLLIAEPEAWTIAEQDAFRAVIDSQLVKPLLETGEDKGQTWLTISFTAERRWL